MMRRTAEAVSECAESEQIARPSVIAVTVLTSADASSLAEVGYSSTPAELVRQLVQLAAANGMNGVVASPQEIGIIRSAVKQDGFVVVTPGVRPAGASLFDQKRVTTPGEAIIAGADYIVVGRPILEAPDPGRAAQDIIEELENIVANRAAI